MSKRIDEGIRRGEFKAADLPESVQKRQVGYTTSKGSKEVEQSSRVDAVDGTEVNLSKSNGSAKQPVSTLEPASKKEIDLSSVDLKGVKLVAATSEPTAAAMPDASTSRINTR